MDDYPIKSVLFGGFNKEDVIRYLENFSKTTGQERKDLEEENVRLRAQIDALEGELDDLSAQLEEASARGDDLEAKLRDETARCEKLESLRPLAEENERLRAEAERLRSETDGLRKDAAAYAQFRERLGAIECEARERADALENNASEKMRSTIVAFNEQYQDIIQTVEETASRITGELRKVEFNLSQLPRSMDQAGRDLNALADRIVRGEEV